jgi:hypothetical protein
MRLVLQIAGGVAAGILIAVAIIYFGWLLPNRDKAAQSTAIQQLLRQYDELNAACLDAPAGQTGALVCKRAIETACEVWRRGLVGDGKSAKPAECN